MSFVARIPEEKGSVREILRPYPEIAKPIASLTQHVMRDADIPFTPRERELIGAFVSGINSCTYCVETHQATAEAMGVEAGLLNALMDDIDHAPVSVKLKPVLRYVRKLTLTPTRMTQADADAVFAAGWDERAFHYAVMICGMFNLYNRLLEGYGIKNTAEFRLTAGRELAQSGYMHVAETEQK
ncbi:MAG: carboxymuconolactone decarboxylase family protein [Gammaproteobacteria bacterium]|nr:carboxymuconolactone decarboxylase family protein [Gammaproteobacteria bacterium]